MRSLLLVIFLFFVPTITSADFSSFSTGPVFEDYGPVADVDVTIPVPEDATFRHSFDISKPAAEGELNRSLVSAARFINMLARAGVGANRVEISLVVHGQATFDVSSDAGVNTDLVAALVDHGVTIIVCGQSAAYYDVKTEDLLPGVEMAVSAMTAHALLQQQGFTLNPF